MGAEAGAVAYIEDDEGAVICVVQGKGVVWARDTAGAEEERWAVFPSGTEVVLGALAWSGSGGKDAGRRALVASCFSGRVSGSPRGGAKVDSMVTGIPMAPSIRSCLLLYVDGFRDGSSLRMAST